MKYIIFLIKVVLTGILIYLLIDPFEWKEEWLWLAHYFPKAVLKFILFALVAHLLIDLLTWWYKRSKTIEEGRADNVVLGLRNIYYLLLTGATLLTAISFVGIDPKALFTSLSIVAAAIAIISKDFIAEIISGIFISFSNEIVINDYVKIGDTKGKIIDITLTKIALLNDDDDILYLPNNAVFTSQIINYTRKEIKKVSVDFELDIKAIKTIEELESELSQVLVEYHDHIEPNSFNLKIVEIRKDSLHLKFQYVLLAIDRYLERDIRKTTVRKVVNYMKASYQIEQVV